MCIAGKAPQRREVEVIPVEVRDEHGSRAELSEAWSTAPATRTRCPIRLRSTGSVSRRMPDSSSSTVEWPSHVTRSGNGSLTDPTVIAAA